MAVSTARKVIATFLSIILTFMVGGMIAVIVIAARQRQKCPSRDLDTTTGTTAAPAVSPTAAPTVTFTSGPTETRAPPAWNPYKNKAESDSSNQWSLKIYNAITGGASANENPNSGGVNTNVVQCGLNLRPTLTQTQADCLCRNPCTWYGQTASDKIEAAGMCNCQTLKATNFN